MFFRIHSLGCLSCWIQSFIGLPFPSLSRKNPPRENGLRLSHLFLNNLLILLRTIAFAGLNAAALLPCIPACFPILLYSCPKIFHLRTEKSDIIAMFSGECCIIFAANKPRTLWKALKKKPFAAYRTAPTVLSFPTLSILWPDAKSTPSPSSRLWLLCAPTDFQHFSSVIYALYYL